MILHMVINFLHYYLVQNNGTTYRYVVSTGKTGIIASDLDSDEFLKTTTYIEKNELPAVEPLQHTIQRHMPAVNTINNSRLKPIQNETLKPVVNYYENNFVEKKLPAPKKMPEYVIQTGEIGFIWQEPETELLRKIRL